MTIGVKKYVAILLSLCVLQLTFASSVFAETEVEAKVKAAFVVNFARFITWPQQAFSGSAAPLSICTVGVKGVENSFAGVESKTIKGRPVALRSYSSLKESTSSSCQIVYVQNVSNSALDSFYKKSGTAPLVSISESDGFSRRGGIIEFVKNKGKLSFKINNSRAKKLQLQIDASLLDLAEEVF